jgi:hypothetical protein
MYIGISSKRATCVAPVRSRQAVRAMCPFSDAGTAYADSHLLAGLRTRLAAALHQVLEFVWPGRAIVLDCQPLNRAMLNYVLPIVLLLSHPLASALDCAAEYDKHLATDLTLTYTEFDQTLGKGMRPLANAGCNKEAADLIIAYIAKNNDTHNSLRWHVAQLRALQDARPEAIAYATLSLVPNENFEKEPLRWNDFVLATIAFLEKDRAAFDRHLAQLDKAKDLHVGNAMNAKLLEKLSRNFDKNYKEASAETASK